MIILLGLPKSGTSSFHELFLKLNYNTFHWKKGSEYIGTIIKNNKINNKHLLCDFEENDCITQMDVCISSEHCYWPQIVDYEQLYFENKDSIFILNKRDPVKLLESFKNWGKNDDKLLQRLYKYNPELMHNRCNDGFIQFVINHYHNIETFFALKPEAKFLIYDIEKDNIDKLQQYIDIKNITEFPHTNKGKYYTDQKEK
jgi:hypothetical protein